MKAPRDRRREGKKIFSFLREEEGQQGEERWEGRSILMKTTGSTATLMVPGLVGATDVRTGKEKTKSANGGGTAGKKAKGGCRFKGPIEETCKRDKK